MLNNARLTAKTILERAKMKGFQEVLLEGRNQNDNEDKSTVLGLCDALIPGNPPIRKYF